MGNDDDDVHGDVLKLLGEDGLRLMTHLIINIYENGEGPHDFSEVTVIVFKKPKATKCSKQCKISHTAHIAKIKARIPIPKMKDRGEN
jgi:hypothetical protein